MPVIHDLKSHPEVYDAVWTGRKTFEIRVNDRDYKPGDRVILREYSPDLQQYVQPLQRIEARIGYLLQGEFGLPEDLCVFQLTDIKRVS